MYGHLQSVWNKVAGLGLNVEGVLNSFFGEFGVNKEIQKIAEQSQSRLEMRGCVLLAASAVRLCDPLQAAYGRK